MYLICEEDKIIGFQTLWELFLASEHESVTHNCIQLLVAINSSLGIEIFPKRTEIFKKFLNKCLHYLREAMLGKKMLLIQKILGLIDDFLVSIEKKKNFFKVRNNNYIIIKTNSERYESFQFNPNLPVKYLRLRISEINEIPIDSFVMALSQTGVEIAREYASSPVAHPAIQTRNSSSRPGRQINSGRTSASRWAKASSSRKNSVTPIRRSR